MCKKLCDVKELDVKANAPRPLLSSIDDAFLHFRKCAWVHHSKEHPFQAA